VCIFVILCVCVCERERECVCMCVCVCVDSGLFETCDMTRSHMGSDPFVYDICLDGYCSTVCVCVCVCVCVSVQPFHMFDIRPFVHDICLDGYCSTVVDGYCSTVVDGYCSTVQGLLDWFEVDLGFTELYLFRQICVF